MNTKQHITLSELNSKIGEAISIHLESTYWIAAEIVELRENYSGHCYLSLVEKEDDKIIAQNRASIWQQTYRMVKPYFESATGQTLTSGIKVLIKVNASYHNVYGLNLTVLDIDPSYTVGELTIRRIQILKMLEQDGVSEMNKELEMPDIPKRIAIISSPTAAGYEDFMNQLEHNDYGYRFSTKLFPAVMQGDGAEASIVKMMTQIFDEIDNFDVVVIIRGGGASTDLACFDNYNIALHLTQFPIPVIVGIGHERDETVLDLVAHTALKTPTAVAAFLINQFMQSDAQIDIIIDRLKTVVNYITIKEKQHLFSINAGLPTIINRAFSNKNISLKNVVFKATNIANKHFTTKKEELKSFWYRTEKQTSNIFNLQHQLLGKMEVIAELSDPKHILKKGYSITLKDGKVIRKNSEIKKGDTITTIAQDGSFVSVVSE